MKFSFKKFVELVDQEEDLTEEQLDEIFGAFATHDEKQKKIAAQKKAEFDERRKALQAKQKVNPKAGTKDEMDQLRDPNDPRKVPAIRPKNATGPWSANGQGRKAEMDWAAQFEAEQGPGSKAFADASVKKSIAKAGKKSIADEVVKDLEEQKKIGVRVTAKALAYPHTHEKEMQKYYDNGMSIEEIADMVKDLARA